MQVHVRYFASLRESLGGSEAIELPDGATVAGLRDALIARGTAHANALARHKAVRCAVDQQVADEATALRPGAEVAFFPPVTGG
jgi:molybdopterin synthase sulfur carrier subunit